MQKPIRIFGMQYNKKPALSEISWARSLMHKLGFKLGRALGKTIKVSAVALYNADGAHQELRAVLRRHQEILLEATDEARSRDVAKAE